MIPASPPVQHRQLVRPVRLTLEGPPATKKTNQRIVYSKQRGHPIIIGSHANSKYVRRVMPQLESAAGALGIRHLSDLINAPVWCCAVFYRKGDYAGDLNNYQQALADVLQGTLLVNDRLIQSWDGSRLRVDRSHPRTEVWLSPDIPLPVWPVVALADFFAGTLTAG